MRSLPRIALASLLLSGGAAALAQDKPWPGVEAAPPYDEELAEAQADSGGPWPWPDFMQVTPLPGQYRTKVTLVSLESPMFDELGDIDMEAMMHEGFPEIHDICVRGDEPQADWAAELANGECGEPVITIDGDRFTLSLQCASPDGVATSLDIDGHVGESHSRLDFRMDTQDGDTGGMTMHMRASTRRTGDCD